MKTIIFLALSCFYFSVNAQSSFIGTWKTIDDKTKEAKSNVEIYESGGKYYGKIVKTLRPNAKKTCEKCPGAKQNTPIVGLIIVENLDFKDNMLNGGKILDPETGNEYKCSAWLEENGNTLKVRGTHWTGIYRTQNWYRVQ